MTNHTRTETHLKWREESNGQRGEENSISSELAQKMVDQAWRGETTWRCRDVAGCRRWRQSQGLSRMDGARSFPSRLRRTRRTRLCSGLHPGLFHFIQRTRRFWLAFHACARGAYGGGFPIKVDERLSARSGWGAPTVQNDIDCARAALALVSEPCRLSNGGATIMIIPAEKCFMATQK